MDGGYESSLYCPFSAVDGGKNLYCEVGQQCCEQGTGTSTCNAPGTCPTGTEVVWGCEEPTADCPAQQVCCTTTAMTLVPSVIDAGACANSTSSGLKGTQCAAQSACITGALFLCGLDSECAAVGKTTCVPVYRDGNEFGACQ